MCVGRGTLVRTSRCFLTCLRGHFCLRGHALSPRKKKSSVTVSEGYTRPPLPTPALFGICPHEPHSTWITLCDLVPSFATTSRHSYTQTYFLDALGGPKTHISCFLNPRAPQLQRTSANNPITRTSERQKTGLIMYRNNKQGPFFTRGGSARTCA